MFEFIIASSIQALRYLKYIDLAAPHVTEEDEAIDPNVENILETIVSVSFLHYGLKIY